MKYCADGTSVDANSVREQSSNWQRENTDLIQMRMTRRLTAKFRMIVWKYERGGREPEV